MRLDRKNSKKRTARPAEKEMTLDTHLTTVRSRVIPLRPEVPSLVNLPFCGVNEGLLIAQFMSGN